MQPLKRSMFLFHFEMLLWTLSLGLVIELFDTNSKEFNECSRITIYDLSGMGLFRTEGTLKYFTNTLLIFL